MGSAAGQEVYYTSIGNYTTFKVTGLTNNQIDHFTITAVYDQGESGQSTEVHAIPSVITIPWAPINVQVKVMNDSIFISWDPPLSDGGSPILYYAIYRGTSTQTEI